MKSFGILVLILYLPLAMQAQNAANAVAAKALAATAVQCDSDASDMAVLPCQLPRRVRPQKGFNRICARI